MHSLSAANSKFALDLLNNLTEVNRNGNIFFSPLGISSALGMVHLGSRGSTAGQIAKTLHFDTVGDVHASFQALNTEINNPSSSYELKLANRLYGEKKYDFLQAFMEHTKKVYQAELSPVDFRHNSEKVRNEINAWVENQTAGKIKDLLAPDAVDSNTKLVLANAVYFKGTWSKKFEAWKTHDLQFRKTKNAKVMVQMMNTEQDFRYNYISELRLSILELPYLKDETSMLILLPDDFTDDSTGLDQLQKELSYENLTKWTGPTNMQTTLVNVSLPKFSLKESIDMISILTKMGITDVFTDSADLSGMTGNKELKVSKVVHKSFVDVNEQGTEAAAATGIVCVPMCARLPRPHKVFLADHPFIFFILHKNTGSILFLGRFCQP
ncbi:leukocyte elastase inhibitor-like [Protopterus annectens]|uniref:leukocyte elastase inhibitor-like n=1 Tax=Protopterus annectens TaxID=7888 RepID=UPI001CFAF6E0|nr:leukocyte elastase inhibitor-like [Protopterus annectens]XP_043921189.1 leukocyte elastase inhibitor-like [Protopterus annectens]